MRASVKSICWGMLLACLSWAQNKPPSGQDLIAKGKELYTKEGPNAALPEFEESVVREICTLRSVGAGDGQPPRPPGVPSN